MKQTCQLTKRTSDTYWYVAMPDYVIGVPDCVIKCTGNSSVLAKRMQDECKTGLVTHRKLSREGGGRERGRERGA